MEAVASPGRAVRDVRRLVAAALGLATVLAAVFAAVAISRTASLSPGPDEYNIGGWVVRNAPNKWLFLAGEQIRGTPSEAEQDDVLRRFFALNDLISRLDNESSDVTARTGFADAALAAQLQALRDERDGLENQVEATLERRLTEVLKEQGLTRNLGFSVVWPPVDAEFTDAPRVIARSPRDRIELMGSRLLREDLSLAEAEAIEDAVMAREDVSALSFPTAGIGAYPTIIQYPGDYYRAVEVIAHEWLHNYLFFRPLGWRYYASNDLRTMNETVADLAGRELATLVTERWPLDEAPPVAAAPPPSQAEGVDLRAELRSLRGEVDDLLAGGRIEDAEALMEQRRRELADQGFYIRRINQAYFAYLNLYAGEDGSPAAVNPIGPKIDELRRRTASLREFVALAGELTSVASLDALLERLPAPNSP